MQGVEEIKRLRQRVAELEREAEWHGIQLRAREERYMGDPDYDEGDGYANGHGPITYTGHACCPG